MNTSAFKAKIRRYYKAHGRRTLPWRKTINPYRVLVSEIMLQQTQVERVVPKYRAFLRAFPTVQALADAPLSDVLRMWQGLGYNRRAKMLHEAAQIIVAEYQGKIPSAESDLVALPGVGSYTASAIRAFSYNQPVALIETNIRSVYLHHFFKTRSAVTDREILPIIEHTLDRSNPREWYFALMDYGAALKREEENPSRRSAHHAKQSPFKGSNREIRGAIVRALAEKNMTRISLLKTLKDYDMKRVEGAINTLLRDGLICTERAKFSLA